MSRDIRSHKKVRDWGFQTMAASKVRSAGSDFLGEERLPEKFLDTAEHERLCWFSGEDLPIGEVTLPTEEACMAPEEEQAAEEDEVTEEAAPSGYIVSVTSGGRKRCLHHLGRCWRKPGLHYADFEVYGDKLPPPEAYHSICKLCWPSASDQATVQEARPSTTSLPIATASSSSSSASSCSS